MTFHVGATNINVQNDITEPLIQKLIPRVTASIKKVKEGRITYLIGNNGTGKSRILAGLANRLESRKTSGIIACISNSIYDKFKFVDPHAATGPLRYLGARNARNAVFHSAIDRQLSRIILQTMLVDRRLLKQLSEAVKMDFSFSLGRNLRGQVAERVDLNTRRGRAREDLLTSRSLAMLERISEAGGRFENLTRPQIRVFMRYLELAIDFDLTVRTPSGLQLGFSDLSTGEQNRTLLFAKVLSVMEEGTVFLIDEPEISLHLHWQMEFHETLLSLLSRMTRYHVVIATHAPIIISQGAKASPDSTENMVVVLRRKMEPGEALGENAPGAGSISVELHSFAEVASHEQLVLRYFQTAPYRAREVSVELAEAVLEVADDPTKTAKAKQALLDLRDVLGISEEAKGHIKSALHLIERGLVSSPKNKD